VNSTKTGLGKGTLSREETCLLTLRVTTNIFRRPSVQEMVPSSQKCGKGIAEPGLPLVGKYNIKRVPFLHHLQWS